MKLPSRCSQLACPRMCVNSPTYAARRRGADTRRTTAAQRLRRLLEHERDDRRDRERQDDRCVVGDPELRHAVKVARAPAHRQLRRLRASWLAAPPTAGPGFGAWRPSKITADNFKDTIEKNGHRAARLLGRVVRPLPRVRAGLREGLGHPQGRRVRQDRHRGAAGARRRRRHPGDPDADAVPRRHPAVPRVGRAAAGRARGAGHPGQGARHGEGEEGDRRARSTSTSTAPAATTITTTSTVTGPITITTTATSSRSCYRRNVRRVAGPDRGLRGRRARG